MSDSKASAPSTRRPRAGSGRGTGTAYDKDVILWSQEQARFLRAGRFAELDIEHLADEIEDVGKSEKRELASRMAVLMAHLLKWRVQPEKRTPSWRATIVVRRKRIALAIKATPSLEAVIRDPDWQEDMWLDALAQVCRDTGLVYENLPETCPWTMEQAADAEFWPG
jgi:hypothetical protein